MHGMQATPPALRKKASRLVGGKCTLLARIDAYGQDPTGSAGASMKVQGLPSAPSSNFLWLASLPRWHATAKGKTTYVLHSPLKALSSMGPCMQEEMSKKIEKWQEKGPAKQGRVLPVPDMEPKKRRGGKRARKYKERYGLTDTKKARSAVPPRAPRAACRASDPSFETVAKAEGCRAQRSL